MSRREASFERQIVQKITCFTSQQGLEYKNINATIFYTTVLKKTYI